MSTFKLYSAQTGAYFCSIDAPSREAALDIFAQQQGFANVRAMWAAGRFEYVSIA